MKKEKPKLYSLTEMNISERSEVEVKKCTDNDTYSAAKDPLPLLLHIIQTHQLAPTEDPLVDKDAAVQAYLTMKQNPGESTKKYRVRMKVQLRLWKAMRYLKSQQQAMRYLKSKVSGSC